MADDIFDPTIGYSDVPPPQEPAQEQDPIVRPAPVEKPDNWVYDEARLGYPQETTGSKNFFDGSRIGLTEPSPRLVKEDLSKKVVVVCDNGLFVEYASVLARTFGKVYYYGAGSAGFGVEGLEVLENSIWEIEPDDVDLWVFPDRGHCYLQEELRARGCRVWGGGLGETLESDRVRLHQDMAKRGLQTGVYEMIKGIDSLRSYLKESGDVFIRLAKEPGGQPFRARNYRLSEPWLDSLQCLLGPLGGATEFVVEQPLPDGIRIGIDGWVVDGTLPKTLFAGAGVKGGHVGSFVPMARQIATVAKGVAPIFQQHGGRGPFGVGARTSGSGDFCLTDLVCRLSSPSGVLCQEMCRNAAEIAWHGAGGIVVEPKPLARYGAAIELESPSCGGAWQPVGVPQDVRPYVKLADLVISDGGYYVPRGSRSPGIVLGFGDTAESAGAAALANALRIEGLDFAKDAIEEALEAAKKAEAFGVKIF